MSNISKRYKSRKQMARDSFINFDGTNLSRDEIINHVHGIDNRFDSTNVHFDTVATSSGLYGVNGAIIDVETNTDTPETIATFSILSRNTTLLEFI